MGNPNISSDFENFENFSHFSVCLVCAALALYDICDGKEILKMNIPGAAPVLYGSKVEASAMSTLLFSTLVELRNSKLSVCQFVSLSVSLFEFFWRTAEAYNLILHIQVPYHLGSVLK